MRDSRPLIGALLALSVTAAMAAHVQPRRLRVLVTAYCAGRCGDNSQTATGRSPHLPGVAVDPHVIPLGSRVRILGMSSRGWLRADDTGSRIRGAHIDLRFQRHNYAADNLHHWMTVEVEPPAHRPSVRHNYRRRRIRRAR